MALPSVAERKTPAIQDRQDQRLLLAVHYWWNAFRPANLARRASSSSMRRSWLYFAMRSVRLAEPVLIWPARGGHRQVGDEGVFGFAGAVRHDVGVVGVGGHLHRLQRFGQRADLVHLDQNRIGDAFFDALAPGARCW